MPCNNSRQLMCSVGGGMVGRGSESSVSCTQGKPARCITIRQSFKAMTVFLKTCSASSKLPRMYLDSLWERRASTEKRLRGAGGGGGGRGRKKKTLCRLTLCCLCFVRSILAL